MSAPSIKQEILHLLYPGEQSLWHGGPSAVEAIRDVDQELAAWKPAEDAHSIWALTLHMAYWKFAVRQRLLGLEDTGFERSPDNFPDLPDIVSPSTWAADRTLLARHENALLETVRSLDDGRLDEQLTGGYRVADQLFGVVLHDVHHVGQILLIKRLSGSR